MRNRFRRKVGWLMLDSESPLDPLCMVASWKKGTGLGRSCPLPMCAQLSCPCSCPPPLRISQLCVLSLCIFQIRKAIWVQKCCHPDQVLYFGASRPGPHAQEGRGRYKACGELEGSGAAIHMGAHLTVKEGFTSFSGTDVDKCFAPKDVT